MTQYSFRTASTSAHRDAKARRSRFPMAIAFPVAAPQRRLLAICRWLFWGLAACAAILAASWVSAAESSPRLNTLRTLPVFHGGRIMPFDSLAKLAVETVSEGGSTVKLGLEPYYSPEEIKSDSRLKPALEIFPDGATRKMNAPEVLLSWLVEPQKWEDVPFIYCAHADLHKVLNVSDQVSGPGGSIHRKYVSPRQIAESQELQTYMTNQRDRAAAAQSARAKYKPTKTDEQVLELLNRYKVFRKLTHDPRLPLIQTEGMAPGNREEFLGKLMAARNVVTTPNDRGATMLETLQMLGQAGLSKELVKATNDEIDALVALQDMAARLFPEPGAEANEIEKPVTLAEAEAATVKLREASQQLEQELNAQKKVIFNESAVMTPTLERTVKPIFRELAFKAGEVHRLSREMHLALYDNGAQFSDGDKFRYGATVYVVPALNPVALDKNRDTKNEAEPWLPLAAVLYGSDDLLFNPKWKNENYSKSDIQNVRNAWEALSSAVTDRSATNRGQKLDEAERHMAASLRKLGESLEETRLAMVAAELPAKQRDNGLIAYTKYPAPGRLDAEVTYNRVKPFQWSWVICLVSVLAFGLSFGVLKQRMFWIGLVLLGVAIAWTAYGFTLRVLVTRWAPVTNMYETVVFVPWIIAVLAAWFILLPLLWTGLKDAWRLTAVPGTWEDSPLSARQLQIFRQRTWTVIGTVSIAIRVGLMAWVFYELAMMPYSDGGRPIFYLKPDMQALSTNNLFVYIVNILCLAAVVWLVPRTLLAAVISLMTVPRSWFERDRHGRPATQEMLSQVYSRWAFGLGGALAAGFFFMLASYAPVLDENFSPLQPVLRSNFWLTIHVLTIVASYGAGLLAWAIGMIGLSYYLFGRYRIPVMVKGGKGLGPADGVDHSEGRLGRLPPEPVASLANYAYRSVQVAVLLLAAGTILGGLWADVSWGRFWGWDPKEVWALITLLVYLAILHGRYAGMFNNFGMIAGTVVGAIMIGGSWYGVNFILPMFAGEGESVGLHSYGSGAGGQEWVLGFMALNMVYLTLASVRYRFETTGREVTPEIRTAELVGTESHPRGT